MECIILAGGLGKRLKSCVTDIPKPLAPVNEKPFLSYVMDYLLVNGVNRIILAVGYRWQKISKEYGSKYKGIDLIYSVENELLGTGGAIRQALDFCLEEKVYIVNGDTFYDIQLNVLNLKRNTDMCMALKYMEKFDRYGCVEIEGEIIVNFKEKKFYDNGFINGGTYLINKNLFRRIKKGKKFSFERFIEENIKKLNIIGKKFDNEFVDIGIPKDYEKAKKLFLKL